MGIGKRESGIDKARVSQSTRAGCPHSPISISHSRPPARARGFTLIELVAVIILIGIALSVAAFSFTKSLDSTKVQAATRDLVAALRYTRGQAIVTGKQAALDLDIQANTYQAPRKPIVHLPKDMQMVLLTAQSEQTSQTSGRIRFFPDGASTGGHIAVRLGQREWRINVSWLTGRVSREEIK
jgi:general secretion pathway protein H